MRDKLNTAAQQETRAAQEQSEFHDDRADGAASQILFEGFTSIQFARLSFV